MISSSCTNTEEQHDAVLATGLALPSWQLPSSDRSARGCLAAFTTGCPGPAVMMHSIGCRSAWGEEPCAKMEEEMISRDCPDCPAWQQVPFVGGRFLQSDSLVSCLRTSKLAHIELSTRRCTQRLYPQVLVPIALAGGFESCGACTLLMYRTAKLAPGLRAILTRPRGALGQLPAGALQALCTVPPGAGGVSQPGVGLVRSQHLQWVNRWLYVHVKHVRNLCKEVAPQSRSLS